MTNVEQIRCFVAVELPEPLRAALAGLRQSLEVRVSVAELSRGVRWVGPDGIHLTLKFLGNVESRLLPEIEAQLREALRKQRCLRLRLDQLGVFPSPRASRVIWVGLGGDLAKLGAVQRSVEEALAPLGFPTESRPFKPHLTLARVSDEVDSYQRRALGEIVLDVPPPSPLEIPVREISLMRSELSPKGARYSRLFAVPLSCP